MKPNVTSLSEFAAGVNLNLLLLISDAVISWSSVTSTQDDPLLYSKSPALSNVVILTFDKLPPSVSAKLKSLAANTFVILDGVLSPAVDSWLFSLMYTVELDAVGAELLIVIVNVASCVAVPSDNV